MPLKTKREREEPCHICQHYHDYEGGEPCAVCGHTLGGQQITGPQESVYPTEVLPGFLFLGSYDNASRTEVMKALGITHILNTVPACPELYKNSFTYRTVSTSPPDFQECFAFLDQVERQQDKLRVLVHCMTGVTKSPAVVIAYLMKFRQWRLSESYKWVKDKRPTILLSAEEAQRLQALEVALLGASSTGWQPSTGPREPMPSALSAPAAPFAWSWRDTPVPAQPSLVPQPAVAVGALSFGAGVAPPGGFVFGARSPLAGAPGGAPASGDMAMES